MRSLDRCLAPVLLLLAATACGDGPAGAGAPTATALAAALAPGQVLEIGTLGGQTIPVDITDKGMVVGTDWGAGAQAFRWTEGSGIEDLDTPAGWTSQATAANRQGVVVGIAFDGVASRGVMWDADGARHDLPAPPAPFDWAAPFAVNDHGLVAGFLVDPDAEDPDELALPFRWTAKGGYRLAEYPFGTELRWGGLNDHGDIVGSADPLDAEQYGVYLDPLKGGMVEIGSMSGIWTEATAINDRGRITGFDYADIPTGFYDVPFIWDPRSGFQLLGGFSGSSRPNGINDHGEIVGFATDAGGTTQFAFYWSDKLGVVDLGAEAGLSDAYAINKRGQVAGVRASDGAAVVWTGFATGGPASLASGAQLRRVTRAAASAPLPCRLDGDAAFRADLLRCAIGR
jgi:probable HAF family extracellular repeat protein